MNTFKIFYRILSIAPVMLFGLTSAEGAQTIDPSKTLYFTLDDSSGDLSMDEFVYLKQAIEDTFAAENYLGDISVKRWGANKDLGEQSIALKIIYWKSVIPGELECRLYATASIGESKNDLGVIKGSDSRLAATVNRQIERFRRSAAKCIESLIDELQEKGLLENSSAETE